MATTRHTAVILAAGRGSRLGAATDERPKCLVEVAGRPLLEWQIAALRSAGIGRIAVVTGYRSECVECFDVETIHNPDWSHSNMVSSLLCAIETLEPPYLVCYSDIIYRPEHPSSLLHCGDDLAITYDTNWLDLWRRRFDDPLSDAETFQLDEWGYLREIGAKPRSLTEVEGQFMGLFRVSAQGAVWITDFAAENSSDVAAMDTTGLFRNLLGRGHRIRAIPVAGGWCEIDSQSDLLVAESMVSQNQLPLPAGAG